MWIMDSVISESLYRNVNLGIVRGTVPILKFQCGSLDPSAKLGIPVSPVIPV